MICGAHEFRRLPVIVACLVCITVLAAAQAQTLEGLERAVAAEPESLRVAADYRQLAIAAKTFDRSIDFLERLANRRGSGPNVKISLALAYVDKVPTAGDIRRLYLGRSAMGALTESIEQRPTALAYYVRGRINLYYNNFIFHRTQRGIDDLLKAFSLLTPETPMAWQVYATLGDGYWRLDDRNRAREWWRKGLASFPDMSELTRRASGSNEVVSSIVGDALSPDKRVDTSLRGFAQ